MDYTLHDIVHPLVDHDVLRAATDAVQRTTERAKDAEAALAQAQEVRQAAYRAHTDALHEGTESPAKTKRVLADADEALELAQEVRDARERNRVDASIGGIEAARSSAYRKVLVEGIRRRMDAIRAGEIARKALAEAEDGFKIGTAMLGEARANGVPIREEVGFDRAGLVDHLGNPTFARTEEHERAVWAPQLNVERTLEKGEPTS